MTYIPKEAQDRIDELEDKLYESGQQHAQVSQELEQIRSRMGRTRSGVWIWGILAVLLAAWAVYQYLNPRVVKDESALRALQSLQMRVDSLQRIQLQTESAVAFDQGLWYFVQIGAYKNLDLSMFESGSVNFRMRTEDSLMKYTLGSFRDFAEAERFVESIRKMGIKDAFILAFNDGQRITIEESKQLP
ncbi:hypothetical protein GC167_00620 [bacterium]|nr:hypothetical protein [bacterium]